MPRATLGLTKSVDRYLNAHSPEPEVMRKLREVTAKLPMAMMQIAPSQGAFMTWVLRMIHAERTIEVGVFTGGSTLLTALALPEHGRVLACDVSEEWTNIARAHWKEAGVDRKIHLVLQPAVDTLKQSLLAGEASQYDFAFIDADKEAYGEYYELCLRLVRRGGVIMLDNMLWGGSVANKTNQSPQTRAIRELNRKILEDTRVDRSLVPVGDGLMLVTKR